MSRTRRAQERSCSSATALDQLEPRSRFGSCTAHRTARVARPQWSDRTRPSRGPLQTPLGDRAFASVGTFERSCGITASANAEYVARTNSIIACSVRSRSGNAWQQPDRGLLFYRIEATPREVRRVTARAPKVNRPPFADDPSQWTPYVNGVMRRCRINCPRQDWEDATQEAILEIVQQLPRVDPTKPPKCARAWLGWWARRGAHRIADQNRSVISGVHRPTHSYRRFSTETQRARDAALFGRVHDNEGRGVVVMRDLARDDESCGIAEANDDRAAMRRMIEAALPQMRRRDAEFLRLTLAGLNRLEIARATGLSKQRISQIANRAIPELRRLIKRAVAMSATLRISALDHIDPNWRNE